MANHSARLVLSISLALAASYWCVNPASLHAQTVSGTILGIVQDQQGGALAKAEVSARSVDTGAVRKTIAGDNGEYRIVSVPAGSYEISTSAAGFKTEVRSGIVVTVGGDVAVNFSLTVGAITEKVEVTGDAPQVDTSSSTLGGFVNSATIRELPLNGRDWLQLALLQPGAVLTASQNSADGSRPQRGNGLAISISGGRPTDNAFRIDGLIVNDYANGGPGSTLRVNMGVDAIREFSVLTNNYSAEYGRGSGGIVNAITKSGTNGVHGSAYYFHRNSALDTRNFFDKATPPFRRHQYGGAVGGAIRKDKTFFFTNYEGLTEVRSLSFSSDTISANPRNGILCGNAACTTSTPITVAPSVKPYLALYPLPNGPVTGNTGKFLLGAPRLGDEKYVIGKIDHYFSPTTTLFGSYSFDDAAVTIPDAYDLKTLAAPARRQNVVLSLQHLFSPTLINNTRVGVSRTFAGGSLDCCAKNPALENPALGFIPGRNLGSFVISGITVGQGAQSIAGIGATSFSIWGYTAPQVYNDLSWTKGRHSIRTGLSVERIQYNLNSPATPNGTWTFTSVQSFLQATPSAFASDFPGNDTPRGERMSLMAGYIQDDFRVRSNLTINLGMRYEMGTTIKEVNGKLANLRNFTDPNPTVGEPYYNNPTLRNFAPRVGFAWDPFGNGKTAIRGGFGMFDIIPLPYIFQSRIAASAPFALSGSLSSPPASSFPNRGFPLLVRSTLRTAHIELNPHRTYKGQWNLNIQRQLSRNTALTVGYVGSTGVHLAYGIQDSDQVPASLVTFSQSLNAYVFPIPAAGARIQRINPNFGQITSTEWRGHSSYHSLQANLVQRPVKGLTYQIAYTWAKSIDNSSATFNDTAESLNTQGAPYAFDPATNRGVSDFHIPHNVVLNFQYDLPILASMKANHLTNTVFGGWQIGGIYTRQSGGPFGLKVGGDPAFTGNNNAGSSQGVQRPMFLNVPGCSPNAITGDLNRYIKTECFTYPAPGVLGNLGRNTFHMPVFRNLDFSVFKNQNVWSEKLKAQFRVEMFNLLNNTNLAPQTLTIFDGTGKLLPAIQTPAGPTVNTSRQIQLGLRLLF